MKKTFSFVLVAFGLLIVLSSLVLDAFGIGKPGIQSAQILGIQIGVLFMLTGGAALTFPEDKVTSLSQILLNMRERIARLPALFWVMLGALPAFIFFFVIPTFSGMPEHILYPDKFIPPMPSIGYDLMLLLEGTQAWLQHQQTTPYIFAPFVHVLFAPFLLLGEPRSYYLLVFITLTSYFLISWLAILMSESADKFVIGFIAAISSFSYGLIYELERGQTYTFSLALCFLAIYIFHRYRTLRWLAYLLFCVGVQFEFSPALLVILFVDDWRDWKSTLKRFVALGAANFFALFLFGYSYFYDFYSGMTGALQSSEVSRTNHSINSFAKLLGAQRLMWFSEETTLWFASHAHWISGALYIFFIVGFLLVLARVWIQNKRGLDPDLFLVSILGMLMLPSINHDYTLPLLMAPVDLSITEWNREGAMNSKTQSVILTVIASFAYFSTLITYEFRPLYLENSMTMILILLAVVTFRNIPLLIASFRAGKAQNFGWSFNEK
jgi:hypothetical protein